MTKNILTVMGALLVLIGILGFGVPGLFGMHLSPAHNLIHLVSGCVALYFGLTGALSASRIFSLVFGLVYGLLGLIGLIAGGTHGMWAVIPNQLVLGTPDHIVHLILGGVFVFAGLDKCTRIESPHRNS
jgi:hypothetical protein